jgi:hypothetical protein
MMSLKLLMDQLELRHKMKLLMDQKTLGHHEAEDGPEDPGAL